MTASTPDVALRALARAARRGYLPAAPADSGDRIFVTLLSLNFMLLAFFVVLGTASTFDKPRAASVAHSMHVAFATPGTVLNSASPIRLSARQALQAGVSDAFSEVLPLARRVTGDDGDRVDVAVPIAALSAAEHTRDGLLDAIAMLMRTAPVGVHYQLVVDGDAQAADIAADLLERDVIASQLLVGSDLAEGRVRFSFLLLEGDDDGLSARLTSREAP